MISVENQNIQIQKIGTSKLKGVQPEDLTFGKDFTDHMFVSEYRNGQWESLRIMPFGDLSLNPATTSLHYGQAIFEGMKAYKGPDGKIRLFRPNDNAHRLNISAKRMCMPEFPEDMFLASLKELLKVDSAWVPSKPGCSLYLRPFMFADDYFLGVKPATKYKFMIIGSPASSYYSEPVKVKVERNYSRAAMGGVGFAKAAGNYAAALYPAKMANEQGYHQLIWMDSVEHRYIEEAGTMNLMFIIEDKLITPELNGTILAGITRDSVMTLAKKFGYQVEERRVSIDEIIAAYEVGKLQDAFGMGTAANIAPISMISVDNKEIKLPPIAERTISNKISKLLADIKTGQAEDEFGWVEEVGIDTI